MPFAVKNIAVPKVAESDRVLNIPASRENAFVNAETAPPYDPILTSLKLNAKAEWRLRSGGKRSPDLDIHIELQGKPAETASSYGEIDIESALDASGSHLEVFSGDAKMRDRFCDPAEGPLPLTLSLPAPPALRKIRELRGTMSLQTGGRIEIVAVKDLPAKIKNKDAPIDDAALKALGIVVKVEHQNRIGAEYDGVETLDVDFQWKYNPVPRGEVFDKEGDALRQGHFSIPFWLCRHAALVAVVARSSSGRSQLRFLVHTGSRKIRVPFVFKDIDVPPMPKEQDGAPGFGVPLVPAEEKK